MAKTKQAHRSPLATTSLNPLCSSDSLGKHIPGFALSSPRLKLHNSRKLNPQLFRSNEAAKTALNGHGAAQAKCKRTKTKTTPQLLLDANRRCSDTPKKLIAAAHSVPTLKKHSTPPQASEHFFDYLSPLGRLNMYNNFQ
jgi:hypothetical protein